MKKLIIITGTSRGLGKALVDLTLIDEETKIISLSRSLHDDHKGINSDKLLLIKTDLSEPFSMGIIDALKKEIRQNSIIYFFKCDHEIRICKHIW